MASDDPVRRFLPRPEWLQARIRELARDSANIFLKGHAEDRREERDIFDDIIIDVLRRGYISGGVRVGRSTGEWKCKMTLRVAGAREVGVVSVVVQNRKILVVTAEWEDLK